MVLEILEKNGPQSREDDVVADIVPHIRPETAAKRFARDHKRPIEHYDMFRVISYGARRIVLIQLRLLMRQGRITREEIDGDPIIRLVGDIGLVNGEVSGNKKRPRGSRANR